MTSGGCLLGDFEEKKEKEERKGDEKEKGTLEKEKGERKGDVVNISNIW
jgi:hypothetical protein